MLYLLNKLKIPSGIGLSTFTIYYVLTYKKFEFTHPLYKSYNNLNLNSHHPIYPAELCCPDKKFFNESYSKKSCDETS